MQFANQALRVSRKHGLSYAEGLSLAEIAMVYVEKGESLKTIDYLKASSENFQKAR